MSGYRSRQSAAEIRAIALVDPVGDAGIGGHTHELAEGLVACGIAVKVYAPGQGFASTLPRRYQLQCLHQPLEPLPDRADVADSSSASVGSCLEPYFEALERRGTPGGCVRGTVLPQRSGAVLARPHLPAQTTRIAPAPAMSDAELDAWAAAVAADVDVVWTQWPDVGTLNAGVRSAARRLGGRWVHTVHNVHPHEADTEAILRHAHAYRDARGLVVHSRVAAEQLVGAYPATRSKVIESRLGLYSVYPRRPAARDAIRRQLGVAVDDRVVLIFGGIRPYKNIDAALEALRDPRCNRIVLVIAGWEWGYPEAVIGDRLGRSRRLVCDLGVADRVRLLPGPFGRLQSAELFEASDAALLPYLQGSGSALLLMAMSFRKPVVLTDAGGMHEYVAEYPGAIPLHGATAHDIAVGLGALEARDERFDEQLPLPAALKWPAIARETVGRIERLFGRTGPGAR